MPKKKKLKKGRKIPEYPTIAKRKLQPQGQGIAKDDRESKARVRKLSYEVRLAAYAKTHKLTLQKAAVAMMLEES